MAQITVTTERIEKAVEQATLAYWAEIVKHFPEVETGDDAGMSMDIFMDVAMLTLEEWLRDNHPNPSEEIPPHGFMNPAVYGDEVAS